MTAVSKKTRIITRSRYSAWFVHSKKNGYGASLHRSQLVAARPEGIRCSCTRSAITFLIALMKKRTQRRHVPKRDSKRAQNGSAIRIQLISTAGFQPSLVSTSVGSAYSNGRIYSFFD